MKQLVLDIAPAPAPTLDNFVAGRNAELLHLLKDLAAGRSRERFVYIWGEPGCGRSHLLTAFVAAAAASGHGAVCTEGAEGGPGPELAGLDAVALDGVQRLDDAGQIALFNLCNRMREGRGALLVSGPAAPAQLALRPDLVSRLAWGLVYQVHALSDGEKADAMAGRARQRGFALAPEVAGYLLRHWRRDLPSLLGMVDALDRYSLETKRPVTLPLLRRMLAAP